MSKSDEQYLKEYNLPLDPMSICDIVEQLTIFLFKELKCWNLTLTNEGFSSLLGAVVAHAVNEANENQGKLNLKKSMLFVSARLNEKF